MILGMQIALFVIGIMALIRGRITLSKTRVVVGISARLLGLLALTPFPLSMLAGVVVTMANVDDPTDPQKVQEWTRDNEWTLIAIQAGVVIGIGVLIFLIASVVSRPVDEVEREITSRKTDDYDDYDSAPRKNRDYDD